MALKKFGTLFAIHKHNNHLSTDLCLKLVYEDDYFISQNTKMLEMLYCGSFQDIKTIQYHSI